MAERPEPYSPLIVIDESLSPNAAEALRMVDYNVKTVQEVLGSGAKDPAIFKWLGIQGAVWVTADEQAKRKYANELCQEGISVVFVKRPRRGGMSAKEQLLLLLWVLDEVLSEVRRHSGHKFFRAHYLGKRPKLERI